MKDVRWRAFGCLSSAAVACAVVTLGCLFLRQKATMLCGGEFIYPIDDAYIHIKMAKTLAESGTWGIESGARAFCSSSPLWTLVLAAFYAVFGWSERLPWFLSLGFNLGSVVVINSFLFRLGFRFWGRLLGVCAVAAAAPFYCTTALGMEHAMHAFFLLTTVLLLLRGLAGSRAAGAMACAAAFCATGSRYESLFFLLPLGVGLAAVRGPAFLRTKDWRLLRLPFFLLLAAGLPVLIYGGWAVCAGGHFLPNSLLLKGKFSLAFQARPECFFLYVLAAASAFCCWLSRRNPLGCVTAASVVVAIGGQLLFADVGQLCRYEAYLVALGLTVCLACVWTERESLGVGLRWGFAALLCAVFFGRSLGAWRQTTWASTDILAQQVTMTRIMASLPEEDRGCIALNDLGYLSLHGGAPVLDLWGLGSQDMAELNLAHKGEWDPEEIERLMKRHRVQYAVLFESWYPRSLMPDDIVEVGYLELQDNRTCGGDKVAFRATSKQAAKKLYSCLKSYDQARLPKRAKLVVWPLD